VKKVADSIKKVGLTSNAEKSHCAGLVRRAAHALRDDGRTVICDPTSAKMVENGVEVAKSLAELGRSVDLLLVVGGDGTMLGVAREMAGLPVPMLGVNAGNLGFLTAVPPKRLEASLRQVFEGAFSIESRALLESTITQNGTELTLTAMNDFVLSRGVTSRMIELEVTVDGELLTRYRCDGLIASSPTGSTAYSLAAGGAIVSPDADVMMLTPICPHTLSIRPIVVNLAATVRVTLKSKRLTAMLAADGQQQLELRAGDSVKICRNRHSVRLVRLDGQSFFSTLRQKFAWSGTNL
jgi:NAD+ kinase